MVLYVHPVIVASRRDPRRGGIPGGRSQPLVRTSPAAQGEGSIRKRKIVPEQTVDLLLAEHSQHPENPYMFPSPATGHDPDAAGRIHKNC